MTLFFDSIFSFLSDGFLNIFIKLFRYVEDNLNRILVTFSNRINEKILFNHSRLLERIENKNLKRLKKNSSRDVLSIIRRFFWGGGGGGDGR